MQRARPPLCTEENVWCGRAPTARLVWSASVQAVDMACRSLVGIIFLVAALSKGAAPNPTMASLAKVLPAASIQVALWTLVSAEIVIGAMLLTGAYKRTVYLTAASVLMLFTAWVLYLKHVAKVEGCACGFERLIRPLAGMDPVYRNLSLLTIIAAGLIAAAVQDRMRVTSAGLASE